MLTNRTAIALLGLLLIPWALKSPNGNADAIIDVLLGPVWLPLPNGKAAKQAADNGAFVIAGLKSADHNPLERTGISRQS